MTSRILLSIVFLLLASKAQAQKTLKVAIPNEIVTLDPLKARVVQDRFILPLIFQYLVMTDSNGELQNVLIKNWEFDDKKKLLRITIRDGQYFSDGSEVKIQDLMSSFKVFCDPKNAASLDLFGLEGCGDTSKPFRVKYINATTAEMKTTVHASTLLYQLAYGRGAVIKKLANGKTLGSGPFQVETFSPARVVLARNPYYKRNSSFEGGIDKIEFQHVPVEKISEALKSGDIHLASMYLSSNEITWKEGQYDLFSHAPFITQTLVLNPKVPPFDNKNIRGRFLKEIFNEVDFGKCFSRVRKAYGVVPDGIGGSIAMEAPKQKVEGSNPLKDFPELAKSHDIELLRHLGRKNECEENLIIAVGKKFNLNIKFKHLDDYKKLLPLYSDKRTQGYVELMAFVSRDPSFVFRRFLPESKEKIYFYSEKKYKDILSEAWQKENLASKFPSYRKLTQDIQDYGSVIPLYYVGHTRIIHNCIHSAQIETSTYNPNSFLFLDQFQVKPECFGNAP